MNNYYLKNIIRLLFWLNIIIFSSFSYADDKVLETEKTLLKLQKEINQLDKNIKKNTATKNNLSNELKKKERKISKTKKELYKINKKFKSNKKEIKKLNAELTKLKKDIKVKKKSLSSRLYQAYTKGNPGYLQMFLDGVNPSQISRESYYIGYYSQYQNANIESIKKAYKDINKTKNATNKALKKVASLKKQKEKNAKKLQKQKKEKTKLIKKIKENKKDLKHFKIKISDIESDLLYSKKINITTLFILLTLKNINLLYYTEKLIYQWKKNGNEKMFILKHNILDNIYINEDKAITDEYFESLKQSRLLVDSLKKPVRGLSYYKVGDLKEIYKILKINIMKNAKKTFSKKELYEKIIQKIS